MGEVEVFQIHIENVIVIGYFNVVFVALAVRPRFGAVAYLDFLRNRQDILFIKEHFKGIRIEDLKQPCNPNTSASNI